MLPVTRRMLSLQSILLPARYLSPLFFFLTTTLIFFFHYYFVNFVGAEPGRSRWTAGSALGSGPAPGGGAAPPPPGLGARDAGLGVRGSGHPGRALDGTDPTEGLDVLPPPSRLFSPLRSGVRPAQLPWHCKRGGEREVSMNFAPAD